MICIDAWRDWSLFTPAELNRLQLIFSEGKASAVSVEAAAWLLAPPWLWPGCRRCRSPLIPALLPPFLQDEAARTAEEGEAPKPAAAPEAPAASRWKSMGAQVADEEELDGVPMEDDLDGVPMA